MAGPARSAHARAMIRCEDAHSATAAATADSDEEARGGRRVATEDRPRDSDEVKRDGAWLISGEKTASARKAVRPASAFDVGDNIMR